MVDNVLGTRVTATKSTAVSSVDKANVAKANSVAVDKSPSTSVSGQTTLERAMQIAKDTPEVDRQKVDEIRDSIAKGEFKIDPKAIAKAFVEMTYGQ